MKSLSVLTILGFVVGPLLTPMAVAQTEFAVGSIIRGFEMPRRDENGELQQTINGEQATVMTLNRIRVDGLRIDVFEDGRTNINIRSPQADFWRMENRLTTQSGVNIQHPSFTLEATQMDWELEDNRGIFKDRVNVTLNSKIINTP